MQFANFKLNKAWIGLIMVAVLVILSACGNGAASNIENKPSNTNSRNSANSKSSTNSENSSAANKQNTGSSAGQAGESRTIRHELGETVIKGKPQRVVTLEFSFVDSVYRLGVTPVGIAQENDDDVSNLLGQSIESTTVGTRQQPNLETISTLQPDLIIADLNRHKDVYKELSRIAPTIILNSRNASYEDNLTSFKTIAAALGKEDEATSILEAHQKVMDDLKKKVKADDTRKVMIGVFRTDSLSVHSENSFTGQLLARAGIENAITDTKEPTVKVTLEQISAANPDVIFMAEADDKLLEEWKKNPLWQNINAVKNNEVHTVNRALWTRFRGIGSAESILKEAIQILYPDSVSGK